MAHLFESVSETEAGATCNKCLNQLFPSKMRRILRTGTYDQDLLGRVMGTGSIGEMVIQVGIIAVCQGVHVHGWWTVSWLSCSDTDGTV